MEARGDFCEVKIFRFEPATDKEPRFESYRVPYQGYTVMNVLEYICEHYDASLAFRSGCLGKGSGRCGVCLVMVNGIPTLSCQKMAERGMVVEPHPKFEIIKDIAIDLRRIKKNAFLQKTAFRITVDQQKCIGCKDCVYICPVGVYRMEKVSGKYISKPTDTANCCGLSCQMCECHCSRNAISIGLSG